MGGAQGMVGRDELAHAVACHQPGLAEHDEVCLVDVHQVLPLGFLGSGAVAGVAVDDPAQRLGKGFAGRCRACRGWLGQFDAEGRSRNLGRALDLHLVVAGADHHRHPVPEVTCRLDMVARLPQHFHETQFGQCRHRRRQLRHDRQLACAVGHGEADGAETARADLGQSSGAEPHRQDVVDDVEVEYFVQQRRNHAARQAGVDLDDGHALAAKPQFGVRRSEREAHCVQCRLDTRLDTRALGCRQPAGETVPDFDEEGLGAEVLAHDRQHAGPASKRQGLHRELLARHVLLHQGPDLAFAPHALALRNDIGHVGVQHDVNAARACARLHHHRIAQTLQIGLREVQQRQVHGARHADAMGLQHLGQPSLVAAGLDRFCVGGVQAEPLGSFAGGADVELRRREDRSQVGHSRQELDELVDVAGVDGDRDHRKLAQERVALAVSGQEVGPKPAAQCRAHEQLARSRGVALDKCDDAHDIVSNTPAAPRARTCSSVQRRHSSVAHCALGSTLASAEAWTGSAGMTGANSPLARSQASSCTEDR